MVSSEPSSSPISSRLCLGVRTARLPDAICRLKSMARRTGRVMARMIHTLMTNSSTKPSARKASCPNSICRWPRSASSAMLSAASRCCSTS